MTKNELYAWIADYTTANGNYMRGNNAWEGKNYNCYRGINFSSLVYSNFSIPSDEVLLSCFDAGYLSSVKKGIVFTDKNVHYISHGSYRDGYKRVLTYAQYNSFDCNSLEFEPEHVRVIMHNVYNKICAYEAEQRRSLPSTEGLGGLIIGAAALLFGGAAVIDKLLEQRGDAYLDEIEEKAKRDMFD